MAIGVKISGTGSYLPDKILTNKDLEKFVDTSDEWITTRTGIKERRIASDTQSTSCLLYTSPSPRDRQKSRMPSSA